MDDPNLSSGGADAESDHQSDAQSADKPSNNGGNNLPPPNGNNITEFGFFHFILINNDSHVDADDVVVSVGFSKNLACAPDAGWEVVESKSSYGFNGPSSEKITRKLQEWAFGGARNNFGLLSGNGIWLPNIQIKQENLNEGWGSFDIMARAKGSPAELLSMKVIFCRNPPNLPPIHKPFLILAWTNSNDQEILKITPKQSIEMQR